MLTAERGNIRKMLGTRAGAGVRYAALLGATLYRLVFHTSVITGLQGIARTMVAIRVLGLRPDPVVIALAFTLPTFIYGRDRLVDADPRADLLPKGARARFVAAHRRPLKALVASAGVASVLLLSLRPMTIAALAVVLGFSLTYTVRWLPGRRSPKQLPGFKTPYVAILWTAAVVALPLLAAGAPWTARSALLSAVIFLVMATIVTINDIYDLEEDRRAGTCSLAVVLGERWTKLVSCLFSLTGAVVAAVGLGSAGLALGCCYCALYAAYAESRRGKDDPTTIVMYRASSVVMLLLVVVLG
jgi:4-hydroxybenzoate polyprenyltransferase